MRKILLFLTAATLVVGCAATRAVADWQPGDGYKMHAPQLPKDGGWDVAFQNGRLADDWMCSETGPVTDIHFWVSWRGDTVLTPSELLIMIRSNLPTHDPDNNYGYSVPDSLLWERQFTPSDFSIVECDTNLQGWYVPFLGVYKERDHELLFQINITNIEDPFIQEEGIIYWLDICIPSPYTIGWKETDQHWQDGAVRFQLQLDPWIELRDPLEGTLTDLAFVITGPTGPPPIPTLTEWGLIIFGVVLLGFITWVFLRRRKVVGVRV